MKLKLNKYLVITPNEYFLCNDVPHIINSIKHYCYRLNANQLKYFNSSINTHIKKKDYRQPIKQEGTRHKYIKEHNIWVIELDKEDLKNFSF